MNNFDQDKQTYNDNVCIYCQSKDTCNKNKFKVLVYNDKTTMRCDGYKYINSLD